MSLEHTPADEPAPEPLRDDPDRLTDAAGSALAAYYDLTEALSGALVSIVEPALRVVTAAYRRLTDRSAK